MDVSYPGVFVEEIPGGVRPISGVPTSIVAFIGPSWRGATDEPVAIDCYRDFERTFGGAAAGNWLWPAVLDFFQNGGQQAIVVRLYRASAGEPATSQAGYGEPLQLDDFTGAGKEAAKTGLYALEKADLFNILCIPPYRNGDVDPELVDQAARYCEGRRAMLLVDPPSSWKTHYDAKANVGEVGTASRNAALFFPRLRRPNPFRDDLPDDYVPCGAVAGVIARTDAQRGVWKAAAGLEATLAGVPELSVRLTNTENGELNSLAINCLRARPGAGAMVWGARTLQGKDMLASEWKYIPVRRTALFLEESLDRGTSWVVFEPNDERLWARIRTSVGVFLHDLFRRGAFEGTAPRDAYFVKCDRETTTQADIDQGVVNIVVGFAPLRPAEFVVFKIQQLAGRDANGGGSDTEAATRRRGAL